MNTKKIILIVGGEDVYMRIPLIRELEKEGFAKDARSWLARVGIMSGGNLTEIKSY